MRLTTRIALGFFLVTGLLIGTLAYQLSVLERLQGINQEITLTNLEAARISVWLLEGVEGVREFAAKASVLGDADYYQQWEEWEEVVDADLGRLDRIGLSGAEEQARGEILEAWAAYDARAASVREDPASLPEVEEALVVLRARIEGLIGANEAAVAALAMRSAEDAFQARRVARASAGGALVLVLIASLLLYLSISGPLRRLTRGTRELARGRFEHRLELRGPPELSGLARDFNRMAGRLDELEELKRDFISHVSHELKTPLAAIHETIEIFLEEIPGPLNEKQVRLMELSRASTARLSSMISDLLEASRLEAGATAYHPDVHDLPRICTAVLEEVSPLANEHDLTLSLRPEPETAWLFCDGERVRDIVMNVVTNAVKFSPIGGTVELVIHETNRVPGSIPSHIIEGIRGEDPPFLLLSVTDQGPGIPDAEKDRIFEKFHQAGRKAVVRGQGVGLGLAIAQRLVRAHGGLIWVEDGPGGGSVFRVLLPQVPAGWRELLPTESVRRMDSGAVEGGQNRVPERVAGSVPALLIALGVAGCMGPFRAETEPPPPPAPLVVERTVPLQPAPRSASELALEDARALLAEERYEEARERFRAVLTRGAPVPMMADALWGMAMVHLHPRSPLADPAMATTFLTALAEDFPGTIPGLQAEWAMQLRGELRSTEERVQQQDELLRELNEILEVLRGIDLQRQPTRTPRPDTIDTGSGPVAPGPGPIQ